MRNKSPHSICTGLLLALLALFFTPVTSAALCESANSFDPGPADANTWSGWGGSHTNNRFNNASNNPINSENLPRLTLKWAYGFNDVRSVIGNPTLQGNRIFIGDENGKVYSLDRESACEDWLFSADNGVRSTPLLEQINDRWLLFFGDRSANVYAVDAITGQQVWKVKVEQHQAAIITGAPQYIQLENESAPHRIIIPVSSSEEGLGAVPVYPCCSFQGSVVSLDASNGEIIWKSSAIQDAVRETTAGKFGPSGAAIWSAPTIDLELNQLYVTTGDAYSAPADTATDAVIAMDLLNGNILWTQQGTPNDIWTVICMTPNAFPECGPDQDFGSPGILVSDNGNTFLIAGQKSGIVRAYARSNGNILWQTALVENTTEFGGKIVWGGASDMQNSYWGMGNNEINAVQLSDGSVQWSRSIPPVDGMEMHPGLEGPVTISHDVLFTGSWDGMLRALSTNTGELLWDYNTARSFDTINNTPANGGSIGAVGQVVEDGLLLVTSGYIGVKNGVQGNVLLVFEIK